MDVRLGYKQTDIGVIPEDWETPAIIDAAPKIIDYRGRTPRKLGMDWGGGDIPALSARNVKMGFIDFDEECNLGSESLYMRWMTNGDAAREDIVFTTEAPLGNVALIPDDQRYILSQRTILLKTDSARVYSPFLFQLMLSDRFQKLLAENASGSTAQGIQRKKFETLRIACPPVVEQCAIATALSDVDALLAGLDRLIAKKLDLKQAAMQQLLTGQTRLPGVQGEWQMASLDTLTSRATGVWGKNQADERNCRLVQIIRAGDISQDGRLTATASRYVSEAEYEKAKCELDDLVITTSGNGLGKLWWCDSRSNVAASNFVRVLHPKKSVVGRFLYYALRTVEGLRVLQEHTATSAYPNLRPTYFSTVWIPVPPRAEQTAIATVLTEMDAELTTIEARRDKTRALKQGMMQELLTGRTRLV